MILVRGRSVDSHAHSSHHRYARRRQNMDAKQMKIPGPDHPISIVANPSRVTIIVGGRTVADTRSALTLREASYSPVEYIPRRDVDMSALVRSDHKSYCPYKGDASYFSIPGGGIVLPMPCGPMRLH